MCIFEFCIVFLFLIIGNKRQHLFWECFYYKFLIHAHRRDMFESKGFVLSIILILFFSEILFLF